MTDTQQVWTWLGSSSITVFGILWASGTSIRLLREQLRGAEKRDRENRNQARIESIYAPLITAVEKISDSIVPRIFRALGFGFEGMHEQEIGIASPLANQEALTELEIPALLNSSAELYAKLIEWRDCIQEISTLCLEIDLNRATTHDLNEVRRHQARLRELQGNLSRLRTELINRVRTETGLDELDLSTVKAAQHDLKGWKKKLHALLHRS